MKTEPRTWPMAPDIPDGDADVLDQAEPDFTLDGRCDRCLRFLPGDGRCVCEETAS